MTQTLPPPPPSGAPRPRLGFRILLGASLALNLLVIGLIAGAAWRHGGGPGKGWHHAPPGLQSYAAPYVRALPREARRDLHRGLRREVGGAGRAERRALYAEMLAALRATPFDAAAVEAVLGTQRERVLALQAAGQARWLATVTAMTPEARARYADRLEEELRRRPGRRKDG